MRAQLTKQLVRPCTSPPRLAVINTAVDKYEKGRVFVVLLLSKWHTAAFDHYETISATPLQ